MQRNEEMVERAAIGITRGDRLCADGSGQCLYSQALYVGSVLETTDRAEMAVHELREP